MLASLLYPYDNDAASLIEGWLHELEDGDLIRRYEFNESQYLEVIKWLKHQKINRPSESRLPSFRDDVPRDFSDDSDEFSEDSMNHQ